MGYPLPGTREQLNSEEIADVFAQQGFENALVQFSEEQVGGRPVPAARISSTIASCRRCRARSIRR
jgi:hypothetical protein